MRPTSERTEHNTRISWPIGSWRTNGISQTRYPTGKLGTNWVEYYYYFIRPSTAADVTYTCPFEMCWMTAVVADTAGFIVVFRVGRCNCRQFPRRDVHAAFVVGLSLRNENTFIGFAIFKICNNSRKCNRQESLKIYCRLIATYCWSLHTQYTWLPITTCRCIM